jgi:hypothetical protein
MRTLDANGLVVGASDTIYTAGGGTIRPLSPNPADITIEDIAHALSNQCRFTGHTRHFYSVAEHSLLCQKYVELEGGDTEEQLTALLHDGSEAYLSDIARPIKKTPGFAETYLKYEKGLEEAVGLAFDIPTDPFSYPIVKQADERLLGIEVHRLMPQGFVDAYGPIPLWPVFLDPMCYSPRIAETLFLGVYKELAWRRA